MPVRTIFIARLMGLVLTLLTLVILFQRDATILAVAYYLHDPALKLLLGFIGLTLGVALILTHNLWSGGIHTVVVTVISWLFLLRGLALMAFSPAHIAALFAWVRFADYYYFYDGLSFIFGLYLLYVGFAVPLYTVSAADAAAPSEPAVEATKELKRKK